MINDATLIMSSEDVKALLPQAEDRLLIDRVKDKTSESITGIKNVALTEHFFSGHFPKESMMPGVLILESMVQLANIYLLADNAKKSEGKYYYLKKVRDIKFKEKVRPGDQLVIQVNLLNNNPDSIRFKSTVAVNEQRVSIGTFELAEK